MPNIEDNINEWISIALYDLETAQAMFNTGRYLYVVFMCQQAIEKLLKALFLHKTQKMPPRTHNLLYLVDKIELEISEDKRSFFSHLNQFYLESRYPGERIKFSEEIDKTFAKKIYLKTEEAWKCLRKLLS